MDFPKLDDTQFPNLANAKPYTFKNDFDYSRWQADCKIKLCSVAWHGDYRHTVDWKSKEARNTYFDNLQGEVIELTADSRRVADALPVPLTYEQAAKYNYVMLIDPYPAIDYASGKARRLFYFITDIVYRSPNTTELALQLDYWTTYINDVTITNLMLERGHYPMDAVSVSEYLQNPQAHTAYLTAPDVNYGTGAERVTSMQVHDLGAGGKTVCFASSIPYAAFNVAVVVGADASGSAPTFSDTSARYGYQLEVSGYQFNTGKNYDAASIPAEPSMTLDGNVPASYLYAVDAEELYTGGWDVLQRDYPYFLMSVQAMFILPSRLLDLTPIATKSGIQFNTVAYQNYNNLADFKLLASDFGYSASARNIAKLYTYPYAYLQFSDEDGASFDVRIETLAGEGVRAVECLSLAFPFLNWAIALTNVGAQGAGALSWTELDGTEASGRVYYSPFIQHMVQMGIPTYALRMQANVAYQAGNYAQAQKTRNNALLQYSNGTRSTNTGHANTLDSNATMIVNTTNSGNTQTANNNLSIATSSANVAVGNQANINLTEHARALNNAYLRYDRYFQEALVAADIEAAAATTSNAANYGIGGALLTGALSSGMNIATIGAAVGTAAAPGVGTVIGAILAGAAASALSPAINAAAAANNNNIIMTAKQTQADAAIQNNRNKTGSGNASASAQTHIGNNATTDVTNNNNTLASQSVANNVSLANTTAANSAATTNNNSLQSRNISVMNAQDTLRNTQDNYNYDLAAASKQAPVSIGLQSGVPSADAYARRTFTMRVRTQDEGAINQAAAYFLRYGYAYNGVVPTGDLTGGKTYSYWQAADIWVSAENETSDSVKLAIDAIFRNGTTVWADPAQVGKVSIYER